MRRARCAPGLTPTALQFLFIDFFIQTYRRGVAKRRQARLDGGRKKTK